jgi:hypothetical protein
MDAKLQVLKKIGYFSMAGVPRSTGVLGGLAPGLRPRARAAPDARRGRDCDKC